MNINENLNDIYAIFDNDSECKYYNSNEFNILYERNDSRKFSVIHCNIRSMNANGEDFLNYLETLNLKFDVICLSETWSKDIQYLNAFFPNYHGFHNLRPADKRGGGVSIFAKNIFKSNLLTIPYYDSDSFEGIFISLSFADVLYQIGCVYRPPNTNHDEFLEIFESVTSLLRNIQGESILLGDFNYDMLKIQNDSRCSDFYDNVCSSSLIPVISKPTHHTTDSFSILDNIFVSKITEYKSGIMKFDVSDHMPIFIVYDNIFYNPPVDMKKITYRAFSEYAFERMYRELHSRKIDYLYETDIDHGLTEIDKIIYECYNKACPIKTKNISYKDQTKPWINHDIKNQLKKRQAMFALYKSNRISKISYTRIRNQVTSLIRTAKREYYRNKFQDSKNDVRKTWNIINSILKPHSDKKNLGITSIVSNNEIYVEKNQIASIFNEYFSSIGSKISDSIPVDPDITPSQFMSSISIQNSFVFHPIFTHDVKSVILNLKNSSSSVKTYPTKVLKIIEPIVSPILTKFINKSITNSFFPDSLKTARVIPIFKGGDKSNISNYRPISILPIFSKIFERIAYNQLYSFVEKFKIINDSQFGFRTKRSTSQAILDFMQNIYEVLDGEM